MAFYPKPYCEIAESMKYACIEMSILELWANDGKYDEKTDEIIENLTYENVIDKINSVNKSGIFFIEKNFTSMISDIKYDENGRIIGAKATVMNWVRFI